MGGTEVVVVGRELNRDPVAHIPRLDDRAGELVPLSAARRVAADGHRVVLGLGDVLERLRVEDRPRRHALAVVAGRSVPNGAGADRAGPDWGASEAGKIGVAIQDD